MSEPREIVHYVDRTGWPSGPWDHEPDRLSFKTRAGLPGLIVRNYSGALCGYAAVNPGHPFWGMDFSGETGQVAPDDVLDVHGGITYSAFCMERGPVCHVPEPGEPDNVYWFGFDCHHAGDLAPRDIMFYGDNPEFAVLLEHAFYRELGYVREQVELLAEQLAAYPTACMAG